MAIIEVNDTTIHYERTGHGPSVLFVHGAFGDADNWADQVPRFSSRYTCVSYDRRGYTRSAPGQVTNDITRHTDDAVALIEALELAPCLVVGSSSGAVVSVDLALRHARLLRGMVLCEPPLFSLDPVGAEAAMGEMAPRLGAAMADGGPRAVLELFASFAFPQGWALFDEERRNRLRDNAEVGCAEIAAAPVLKVEPADLATVGVPALVITGTASLPLQRSVSQRLAAGLPNARLVELDSGHLPYHECPEDFAHALSAFADELDQSALSVS